VKDAYAARVQQAINMNAKQVGDLTLPFSSSVALGKLGKSGVSPIFVVGDRVGALKGVFDTVGEGVVQLGEFVPGGNDPGESDPLRNCLY